MNTLGRSATLIRIRTLLTNLPTGEASVAQEILADPRKTIMMSVAELANVAGVSTATVMRFCRTLEFGGFREFKFRLALELDDENETALLSEDVEVGDNVRDIARKVIATDIRALSDTLQILDIEQLSAAIEVLAPAPRVFVFGSGSSRPVAIDAHYRLSCLGYYVQITADPLMQAVSAQVIRKDDVVLAISHSGRTKPTIDAAGAARKAGAKVIALTSFARAPLLRYADISLVTVASETTFRAETMASRITHTTIIDIMYVILASRRFNQSLSRLETIDTVLEAQRTEH